MTSTGNLTLRLTNRTADLDWADDICLQHHYLRQRVDRRARPMLYVVERPIHNGREAVGLCIVGSPHATRNGGWWGYPGLPTQWQVVDLSRIWLDPSIQRGGRYCHPAVVPGYVDRHDRFQPTTATWLIAEVLRRVQHDRIALWPPVQLSKPYHIRLAISYHDPRFHRGAIYRMAGAQPMYTDAAGTPLPGTSGKFGWCWPLPEPAWTWERIDYRPRQLRLEAL